MAHKGPGCWVPPAVLDKLSVGVVKLAQALLQVLAEAAQGQLDDINVAKQLPLHCVAESDQPGGHRRSRVVTWAWEGNLEACGATRITICLLCIAKGPLEGSSKCQRVQDTVWNSKCAGSEGIPVLALGPATKLIKESPGPAGSHPPSSMLSLTPSNMALVPWCSPERAPCKFLLHTQEHPNQLALVYLTTVQIPVKAPHLLPD